jgi:hypothetical protein
MIWSAVLVQTKGSQRSFHASMKMVELKALGEDLFAHENAMRDWLKSELDGKSDGSERVFAYLERHGISREEAVTPRERREDVGGDKRHLVLAFFDSEAADHAHRAPKHNKINKSARNQSVRPPELPGLEALTRADSCVALVEQPPSFSRAGAPMRYVGLLGRGRHIFGTAYFFFNGLPASAALRARADRHEPSGRRHRRYPISVVGRGEPRPGALVRRHRELRGRRASGRSARPGRSRIWQ